jgi:hypothetical protein
MDPEFPHAVDAPRARREDTARLESGLTVLASIGSARQPFTARGARPSRARRIDFDRPR